MKVHTLPLYLAMLVAFTLTPVMGQPTQLPESPTYPDPARFAQDIADFEAADRAQPPPEGAIVGVGSSSMRGWHETIHEDLAPLTIIPRGFGGSTMYDLLHYADRIVLPYRPRAIVVYEGDNDIAESIPPETVAATFHAVVEKVHAALPDCRIYFLAIKPSIARWSLWPSMEDANRRIAAACANDRRLTFVDVAAGMLDQDGMPRTDIFLQDNLHLNRRGYEIWRDILRPILLEPELAFEPAEAAATSGPTP